MLASLGRGVVHLIANRKLWSQLLLYCLLPKPHASYTRVNIVVLPKILSSVPSFLVNSTNKEGTWLGNYQRNNNNNTLFLAPFDGRLSFNFSHPYLCPAEPQPPPLPPLFLVYQNTLDKLERPTNHLNKCTICGLTSLDNLSFALLQGAHYYCSQYLFRFSDN